MRSLSLLVGISSIALGVNSAAADRVADQRLSAATSLDEMAEVFMPEAAWQHQEVTALQDRLRETLAGDGHSDSVFLTDADVDPFSKALLVVLNEEPELPHVRYRFRYAKAQVVIEERPPLIADLVEVSRYNLGPARHAELVELLGEEQVASASSFGQAPDVAWRLITRPIMGQAADITHAARRELSEHTAEKCLGLPCRGIESLNDTVRDWPELEPTDFLFKPEQIELSLLQTGLEQLGQRQRDEQGRTTWHAPEWPESVAAGESFIEISLERGVGQDDALDLVIHHDQLMDDHTRALWERLVALGTGDASLLVTTSDQEPWPRPDW
ncbi:MULTISPECIES: hypothetical protein [unclassified Halomonas]|uniref:hypothetical protein n=1 Tax=unclassified Halomonas TaxID=2609666 RepID=UPI00099071D4|nr:MULTISPECIES: hypothetical protein [unclassified Halomonas]AQU83992.1 hypothetical protein B2G49_16245 [Halomonas sp. 'Soap Lake \